MANRSVPERPSPLIRTEPAAFSAAVAFLRISSALSAATPLPDELALADADADEVEAGLPLPAVVSSPQPAASRTAAGIVTSRRIERMGELPFIETDSETRSGRGP